LIECFLIICLVLLGLFCFVCFFVCLSILKRVFFAKKKAKENSFRKNPTVAGFRSCPRKQVSKDDVPKDIDVLNSSEHLEKTSCLG